MRPRCIPPVTSTGKNRKRKPVLLHGLAHMSIGRYMSEMANDIKKENDIESWNLTKHAKSDFNRKSKNRPATPIVYINEQKISCNLIMTDDYNGEGDFAISLQFDGIELFTNTIADHFTESRMSSYLIPVSYQRGNKGSHLLLTTVGDIFEYEIVRDFDHCSMKDCFPGKAGKNISAICQKEFCPNRLFRDEAYIPELLQTYDSMSMNVGFKDACVVVTYKKAV